ncbi:hypothetical protein F5Y16DRAFT_381199 [Xylariaceae sp. FL0255]|nr:hypothetical protein F5Y16DRAFT_381199 [Xylariaceae sp. FL0255]
MLNFDPRFLRSHFPSTRQADGPAGGTSSNLDLPPPYDNPEGYNASDTVQPTILVLSGRFIHAESTAGAILYELNSDVGYLTRADTKVKFLRHERRMRAENSRHHNSDDNDDEAQITVKQRHIYDLECPNSLVAEEHKFHFLLTAVSSTSRGLGNFGLKKALGHFRTTFKAVRIPIATRISGTSGASSSTAEDVLFEIKRRDKRFDWWDSEGERLAIEDETDGQHTLIFLTPLPRERVDALAAMWCLRLWHDNAVLQKKNTSSLRPPHDRERIGFYSI